MEAKEAAKYFSVNCPTCTSLDKTLNMSEGIITCSDCGYEFLNKTNNENTTH